ncbi:MAG: putative glycoside hydrolase/deacetylase ChbG (UPF0249 family) [Arenicella sp.]|jgi:predicted glycoside hydrolase/deacetylase ChbG (UPF0249 family)
MAKKNTEKLKAKKHPHKLILSSDDYGFSPNVNEGILKAVELGTVTCVHVLANLASEEDIRKLATTINKAGNKCGIGLHLNTNSGPSLLNKSCSLVKKEPINGKYHFYEMEDFNHDKTNSHDVVQELWAQYNKLKSIIGGERIDCISSHYNIHVFSKVYLKIIIKIAQTHGIPMRSPVRWVTKKQRPKLKKFQDGKVMMPIALAALKLIPKLERSTLLIMSSSLKASRLIGFRTKIGKAGLVYPRNLSGHWFGQPSFRALTWMFGQLKKMNLRKSYSSELLMHLSSSKEPSLLPAAYPMSSRHEEFKIVTSDEVVNFCKPLYNEGPVRIGSYRKLLLGEEISYDLGS